MEDETKDITTDIYDVVTNIDGIVYIPDQWDQLLNNNGRTPLEEKANIPIPKEKAYELKKNKDEIIDIWNLSVHDNRTYEQLMADRKSLEDEVHKLQMKRKTV